MYIHVYIYIYIYIYICIYICIFVYLQDYSGWTACHYAAYGNAHKCLEFLVESGAKFQLKDNNDRMPADISKYLTHYDCYRLLTRSKAQIQKSKHSLLDSER
jgi:ankyrin repeat protein